MTRPGISHDALFKAIFSIRENIVGELASVLPPDLLATLDLDTIEQVSGSVVDRDLKQSHSDLLFSLSTNDGTPVQVFVLFEHQSEPDVNMPIRLGLYMFRIWENYRTRHSGPLPLIIPVVLSHSARGWAAPNRFSEMFAEVPRLMRACIPDFEFTVDDVSKATDAALQSREMPYSGQVALWLFRDLRNVERWLAGFAPWEERFSSLALDPSQTHVFTQIVKCVYDVTDRLDFRGLVGQISAMAPKSEEVMLSVTEQILEEGRSQGVCKMLRKQLTLKFGPLPDEIHARIDGASSGDLDNWATRFATATSLGAVFES